MRNAKLTIGSLGLVLALGAWAGAELTLRDGKVLRGADLSRDGDTYLLTLETGEVVTIPAELVAGVELTGEREERPAEQEERIRGAWRNAGAETLGGELPEKDTPSGIEVSEPKQLAGPPVRAPRPHEQLEALGPPASFQKDIIKDDWRPSSDWDMDVSNNNFNPSTWAQGPIDPTWRPESAFDKEGDQLDQHRSEWQESIVDNEWAPTDGFKKDGTAWGA